MWGLYTCRASVQPLIDLIVLFFISIFGWVKHTWRASVQPLITCREQRDYITDGLVVYERVLA